MPTGFSRFPLTVLLPTNAAFRQCSVFPWLRCKFYAWNMILLHCLKETVWSECEI